jgi:hypothetical protein
LPRVSTRGLRLPVLLSTIYSLGRPPAAAGIHSLGSGPRHSSFFILHSSFFILHFSPSQISDPPGRGASVLRAPSIQSQLRMTATCSLQPDTCSLFSQPQRGCGCQPKVATARPGLPWKSQTPAHQPQRGCANSNGVAHEDRPRHIISNLKSSNLKSARPKAAARRARDGCHEFQLVDSKPRYRLAFRPQGARWLPRVSTRGLQTPLPPRHSPAGRAMVATSFNSWTPNLVLLSTFHPPLSRSPQRPRPQGARWLPRVSTRGLETPLPSRLSPGGRAMVARGFIPWDSQTRPSPSRAAAKELPLRHRPPSVTPACGCSAFSCSTDRLLNSLGRPPAAAPGSSLPGTCLIQIPPAAPFFVEPNQI